MYSMLFLFVLCSLLGSAVEVLEQNHSDKSGEAQSLRVSVFAGFVDDGWRKRNTCRARPLMWWDLGMCHS